MTSKPATTISGAASARRLAILLVLLTTAGLIVGCRRGGRPGILVMAVEQPPRGFDPRFSTINSISAHAMQLIYDTLLVKDDHFNFVPSLAESFSQTPDFTSFTFHLRNGVKFHNGAPLTSADVKYTFDTLRSTALKSPIRGSLDKISRIETPDPLTVVFVAREPFYSFLGNLPAIGIIPNGSGQEIINHPIGSGPFKFVSYSENAGLKLAANRDYWGGAPQIPEVDIQIIQDNSTRQAALMSGQVDLTFNAQFDPETIRALRSWKNIQVQVGPGTNIAHLGVNVNAPVLSNAKVRQALAYAIDREVIIHKLLRDQARSADSVLPPEQWAYDTGVTVYNYDPERAKHLLDEAGYPQTNPATPRFTMRMMTTTNQLSRNIASIMQDQFRLVGVALELESLEPATFFDRLARAQFDMYYLISIGGNQSTDIFQFVYHSRYHNDRFNDAISKLASANPGQLAALFGTIDAVLSKHDYCSNPAVDELVVKARNESDPARVKSIYLQISGMLTDAGGANRSRYCNASVDRWIEEAQPLTDIDQEKKLYNQIQETLSQELPQIYLWYPANVLVTRSRVKNAQIDLSGGWYFLSKLSLSD